MPIQFIGLGLAFITSIIIGLITVPILRSLKVKQVVRQDGPKTHLHKTGTPTMGGIIMLLTISIVVIGFSFWYPKLIYILFITLGFGIVGFIDDFIKLVFKNPEGISPIAKMTGLIIVSVIFMFVLIYVMKIGTDIVVPVWSQPLLLPVIVYIIFNLFILISTTNSLNITDGLDGLATGITIIIMTFFTVVAIREDNQEMIIFGSAVTGSCLGFLLFNLKPAKVIMGDTGSLALGGAIAAMAIMLKMPLYLALVAVVPVLETISVMIQSTYFNITYKKYGIGKKIFKMAPIHHHFELKGVKEVRIVKVLWFITIIFAILAYFI